MPRSSCLLRTQPASRAILKLSASRAGHGTAVPTGDPSGVCTQSAGEMQLSIWLRAAMVSYSLVHSERDRTNYQNNLGLLYPGRHIPYLPRSIMTSMYTHPCLLL